MKKKNVAKNQVIKAYERTETTDSNIEHTKTREIIQNLENKYKEISLEKEALVSSFDLYIENSYHKTEVDDILNEKKIYYEQQINKISDLNENYNALLETNNRLENEIKEKEEQNNNHVQTIKVLNLKTEALDRSESTNNQELINQLNHENLDLKKSKTESKQTIGLLNKEISKYRSENEALTNSINQIEPLQAENKELQRELLANRLSNSEINKNFNALLETNNRLENEIKEKEEQNNNHVQTINSLQFENRNFQEEHLKETKALKEQIEVKEFGNLSYDEIRNKYFILTSKNQFQSKTNEYENKKKCPTPGCNGIGNSRTPGAKKHYSFLSCPNVNKNSKLKDNFISKNEKKSIQINQDQILEINQLQLTINDLEQDILYERNRKIFSKVNFFIFIFTLKLIF